MKVIIVMQVMQVMEVMEVMKFSDAIIVASKWCNYYECGGNVGIIGGCVQVHESCLCFAEMLINFRLGQFGALNMSFF